MTDPKITRRQIIKGAAAAGALGVVGLPSVAFAEEGDERIRSSCNLFGTPSSVDEGINVSRGFVNFFMPATPNFTTHSNRTLFHVLRQGTED